MENLSRVATLSLALSSLPIASTVSAEVNDTDHPQGVPEVYENCAERFHRVISTAVFMLTNKFPTQKSILFSRKELASEDLVGLECIQNQENVFNATLDGVSVFPTGESTASYTGKTD